MVIEQVGSSFLEWVHGGDHEPHFIQSRLLAEAFRQCDVAGMDGVEAASEDSYLLTLNFQHRTLNFMISKAG